jgi:hypothetical protein
MSNHTSEKSMVGLEYWNDFGILERFWNSDGLNKYPTNKFNTIWNLFLLPWKRADPCLIFDFVCF